MTETQVSNESMADNKPLFPNIVEKLQEEAKNRPVFSAVADMFMKRERSRHKFTLQALFQTMTTSERQFTKEDYANVLYFLGRIGVGTIDKDLDGNLRSLKNIRFTMQSIGAVALGHGDRLEMFGVRSSSIPPTPPKEAPRAPEQPKIDPFQTKASPTSIKFQKLKSGITPVSEQRRSTVTIQVAPDYDTKHAPYKFETLLSQKEVLEVLEKIMGIKP